MATPRKLSPQKKVKVAFAVFCNTKVAYLVRTQNARIPKMLLHPHRVADATNKHPNMTAGDARFGFCKASSKRTRGMLHTVVVESRKTTGLSHLERPDNHLLELVLGDLPDDEVGWYHITMQSAVESVVVCG